MPFSGKLSLREAIARGLNYNLGAVGQSNAVRQAQGQSQVARSALLPNASGYLAETLQQISLTAEGLRFSIPGFAIPPTIGPFNNIDLRGSLSQSIVDLTAWNNYRSSREVFRASQFAAQDAREMVVLAVCGAYLQVIATRGKGKVRARSIGHCNCALSADTAKAKCGTGASNRRRPERSRKAYAATTSHLARERSGQAEDYSGPNDWTAS